MKEKKDFFIGWQDDGMAPNTKLFLKKRIILLLATITVLAVVLVYAQRNFVPYLYDFGNDIEVTGTLYTEPFPFLLSDEKISLGNTSTDNILLVGYGKLGAMTTIKDMQKMHGKMHGRHVTLKGTPGYGDGKIILSLNDGKASLKSIDKGTANMSIRETNSQTQINLSGEILDPKCYFGLMKPGEGKIHKSCAIRCISGGIPPIFRDERGIHSDNKYFLLLDKNGKQINKDILPFVGEKVKLNGAVSTFDKWDILHIDINEIASQD